MAGPGESTGPDRAGFEPGPFLDSLEPIGWKLGLERMELLCEELGDPQDTFATVHVVGTNGKSSVARMFAAICEAHGYRAGCSLSPHIARWSERVLISGREDPDLFGESVLRTARAAAEVNAQLRGEEITQFEMATAAAFLALAEAGVQVAAVEAGLGGRLDATNTIRSLATVLTSIGLDHTEFLGDTETAIAQEKLAVLKAGTTLVLGPVPAEVRELARATAKERDCDLLEVTAQAGEAAGPGEGPSGPTGGFQRVNFAIAEAAAGCFLGEVSRQKAEEAVASLVIPGRLEMIGEDPPVLADVAHNPAAARALAASLPEVAGPGPVIGVFGTLADKDAPAMLAELAEALDTVVFTTLPADALAAWGRPGARAWEPSELLGHARELGLEGEAAADPAAALERARSIARRRNGTVVIAGSHFLLAPGGVTTPS